jgi:hypothetical protein
MVTGHAPLLLETAQKGCQVLEQNTSYCQLSRLDVRWKSLARHPEAFLLSMLTIFDVAHPCGDALDGDDNGDLRHLFGESALAFLSCPDSLQDKA